MDSVDNAPQNAGTAEAKTDTGPVVDPAAGGSSNQAGTEPVVTAAAPLVAEASAALPPAATSVPGDATSPPQAAAAAAPQHSRISDVKPAEPVRAQEAPIVVAPVSRHSADADNDTATHAKADARRSSRFALLAASMALAAGLGGAVGVAGFAGATRLMMPERAARSAPAVRTELSEEMKSLREAIAQVRIGLRHLGDSIATLRTSLEASGKANGAQFAKVNDAIARLNDGIERTERSQAEPTARLAKVIETLERLERRAAAMAAAPEPTGSILGQPPRTLQQQAQQLQQAQPQASLQSQPIAAPQPQQPSPAAFEARTAQPPVIEDWALRRVVNGIAILESRYGLAEVEVGDTIRGIGRVQEIKRQDGRWVVVTARGLIVPTR